MKKAYLVLSNGKIFEGESFGAVGDSVGELVFNTGVVGYIETMTDPSYYGQIVVQTFPLLGNYGVIEEDFEGVPALNGYVVREWCREPSNFRSQYDVNKFLKDKNIVGICGVDTREITRMIREEGVMNAMICSELPADIEKIKDFKISSPIEKVSNNEIKTYPADGEEKFRVTLIDYGSVGNAVKELCKRGCSVKVVPYNTSAEDILADKPDGVVLGNGPGDPADNVNEIGEIKKLFGKAPIFGICLGHQLLALADGGKTFKLKYGHRGSNQPVKDVFGTRTYITSQNHGYAVESGSVKDGKDVFINANDGTCEGIDYDGYDAFSVQFVPDISAGPIEKEMFFDKFVTMMGGKK
ncbi:MAG: carbamoyl phosphate synthase small subunit [Clostridiales bacterium]|nr:carbamoyl phosphate synthase small subunit [Clostridiales bacterium]